MLSALFKSCLLVALADKGMSSFSVVACIPLVSIGVEDADNGRGTKKSCNLIHVCILT